ncbi:LytTR family two component transcriptional regulator [Gillisia sp. Hel_I_86]|uniref:LytR/AlgR family response regulator transcription factor n=1 Tax=Gillisia sp. Hel_I_86 TaxID=1249981 RepID=UPI001199C996|nr:LytTR family DNA-binding domain-containing protein [Gillisia sp. Hel_I_86]TVZ27871.1 LytTR family two component transcriptional regulator [Gillisia sp. Hel_I_86]
MKNYIIIEKDVKATKCLRTIVDSFDEIKFLGSFKNLEEALILILKNTPDIVFLDIDDTIDNLPEFLLDINQHSKNLPVFIGLSSSEEYAYKAYRYDFFDYLLKPLTELAVSRSVLKYIKRKPSETCETICLKSNKDYQYLNIDDILFLKADNNTTDFHMRDGSVIGAYKTLKTFEDTLPQNFLRIHKSYIINSKFISRIHYGKAVCIIKNHSFKIPFTKTFIHNIDFINASLSNKAFITLN